MAHPSGSVIEQIAHSRLDARNGAWLIGARGRVADGPSRQALLKAYAEAPRCLGREPVVLDADETVALRSIDPDLSLRQWTVGDLGRALLLLSADAAAADTPESTELIEAVYAEGDSGEQRTWLRALPLLPAPERFVAIAIDACRTNILPLFEAIACENPFPARAFPDLNFNQLVLKALSNTVPLSRIVGLDRRLNTELARMARAYASERAAAGRTVPADIGLVTGNSLS